MGIPINTLVYAQRLREAGFSEQQAEGQAHALAAAMTDTLATKQDLREVEIRMETGFAVAKQDLREVEIRMETGFAVAKQDLRDLEVKVDARFSQIDARFDAFEKYIDTRLDEQEKRLAIRLEEPEKRLGFRFETQSARFGEQIAAVRAELSDLERRMTRRLGADTVAAVSMVSVLERLV